MSDLISIVVPVYNVEQYIEQCIDSILQQTYSNIEIILVNDGSTDSSGEICERYAKKDKRIKLIQKKNGGLSDARNYGIVAAKGRYIGCVDSDDWIEADMYEKLYKACIDNDADISVCGHFREYVNKTVLYEQKYEILSANQALEKLIRGEELHDHAWSKLYKKFLFNEIEYPVGKLYEDVRTTYKLIAKSSKVISIPNPLYHYRQRKGSIAHGDFNENVFQLLESVIEIINDNEIETEKYNQAIEHRLLKTKCYILRYMLLDGKGAINKFSDEYKDCVLKLKYNRKRIILDKKFTKVYKLMGILSYFPSCIMNQAFQSKAMQKYLKDNYSYF